MDGLELDRIVCGDALECLKPLPDSSVHCIVTSPPYYALRDYGVDGQIGLEDTPQAFIARLVAVFREARRVLRDDGTCWVNMGDSYTGSGKGGQSDAKRSQNWQPIYSHKGETYGLLSKNLMMIPARLAIAMQDDGWILRSEIVWAKPNPMPESVKDRPTKAHEMIYMFAKSEWYFYDVEAVSEPAIHANRVYTFNQPSKLARAILGKQSGNEASGNRLSYDVKNLRDVWTIGYEPQSNTHYAAYPSKLVETPIKAGCPIGGIVLDPFMGSGTTALVARRLGRHYIGFDINPDYVALAQERLAQSDPAQDTTLPDGSKQLSLLKWASLD